MFFVHHCVFTVFLNFFFTEKGTFFCVALESARVFFSVTFLGFFKVPSVLSLFQCRSKKIRDILGAKICYRWQLTLYETRPIIIQPVPKILMGKLQVAVEVFFCLLLFYVLFIFVQNLY